MLIENRVEELKKELDKMKVATGVMLKAVIPFMQETNATLQTMQGEILSLRDRCQKLEDAVTSSAPKVFKSSLTAQ